MYDRGFGGGIPGESIAVTLSVKRRSYLNIRLPTPHEMTRRRGFSESEKSRSATVRREADRAGGPRDGRALHGQEPARRIDGPAPAVPSRRLPVLRLVQC